MKKRLATGYTFDASAQTIVHADFSDITLEGILMIINVTDQIIIYNFADTAKGGTLSTDTLTLEYDTTSMSDTDKLMIWVDDGSSTLIVSATDLDIRNLTNTDVVTAELSAVDNAVLDTIAAKDFATQTTLAAINTKLTSGTVIGDVNLGATDNAVLDAIAAKDFATQTTLAAINAKLVTGTDIGDVTINNSTGAAAVNIQDGGNTITVDGTVTANLSATDNAVLDTIDAVLDTIKTDTAALVVDAAASEVLLGTIDADTGAIKTAVELIDNAISGSEMQVDVVAALPAGTNAIGKLAANSGVDIGDVDVTSAVITGGGVADDATTPGNPIMHGGSAVETDGTDPGSVSAENDVVLARYDRNRRQLVNTAHPNAWVLYEDHTTAQTNNQLKAAPGANLSLYITDVVVSNGATAGTIKLVEDEGGTPVQISQTIYMAVNGGAVIHWNTPKRLTANKTLGFTSATVTTHSIEVHGYIAP